MDLLSRGFSAVLGSGQEGVKPDSDTAGVVEKLCQRLSTSTLIQDRRDAMRGLRCVLNIFVLKNVSFTKYSHSINRRMPTGDTLFLISRMSSNHFYATEAII